jgi:hypothetical protein
MDPLGDVMTEDESIERLVRAFYKGMLRRDADSRGMAHWVRKLQSGTCTPAEVAEAFLNSEEFRRRTAVPLFVPPGHFYSPIVDPAKASRYLAELEANPNPDMLPGIALSRSEMRDLWQVLLPYLTSAPFSNERLDGLRYYYDNPAYSFGDGSVLHAMLRHFQPKHFVEVGCGWSSACTIDTVLSYFETPCRLTFIDPHPQLLNTLIGGAEDHVAILPTEVQNAPHSVFDELEKGDILFIDGSHVLSTGSDVCFALFEVLPRLRRGVIVHFHDMFWPFEYPKYWVVKENRSWNEIYAIRAFLTHNSRWRIVFFNNYFLQFERDLIAETFPLFLENPGGSLWLANG